MKFQPIYKCFLCGITSPFGEIIKIDDASIDDVVSKILVRQENNDPTEKMLDDFMDSIMPKKKTISPPDPVAMCKCGNGDIGKAFFCGLKKVSEAGD